MATVVAVQAAERLEERLAWGAPACSSAAPPLAVSPTAAEKVRRCAACVRHERHGAADHTPQRESGEIFVSNL